MTLDNVHEIANTAELVLAIEANLPAMRKAARAQNQARIAELVRHIGRIDFAAFVPCSLDEFEAHVLAYVGGDDEDPAYLPLMQMLRYPDESHDAPFRVVGEIGAWRVISEAS